MRLPEPVWAHGGIQLVMYTLPLPHTLEHTPARNFALWRTLKTKKRANKPKRSCQTLYPSHYPQLTKLEQIGQSIVQPLWVYFGPRGWELFTFESAWITRNKIPEIVFFVTEIT